jgi:hypothetical protein
LLEELAPQWEAARESALRERRGGARRRAREVRLLLAARGFAVPDCPGLRIRTLEDLFAYAAAEGVEICMDGTEVQVRRPQTGRPGRKAFVSGETRRRRSSQRIVVEHTNAEYKQWHPLQRYTGRREDYDETHRAIADLVSDRSARRATRRTASTELVPVRTTTC